MRATCKWCGKRHGDRPMWHRNCSICLEPFVQERHRGRARDTCGKPLCVAIQRYRQIRGRWPPREWFVAYAVKAKLVKLPKKLGKIAARCAA